MSEREGGASERGLTLTPESVDDRMVCLMRLVLSISALAVIYSDPSEPDRFVAATYAALALYVLYSAALLFFTRLHESARWESIVPWVDVGCYLVLVSLSSGTNSVFFFFFFFAILVASFRQGFRAGLGVAVVSAVSFTFVGYATTAGPQFEWNRFLLRPVYLLAPGARGRAIGQMERQEGRGKSSKNSSAAAATVAGSTGTAGAQTTGFGGMAAAALNAPANSPSWTPVGPAPLSNGQTFGVPQAVSGRVTAIAIHPTISDIAYVGTAQGGVYRTLDGGQSWTAVFDNAQSLAVGAIVIAPSQPSTVYVGTGEPNQSCDSFFGVGVYRIDNADSTSPQLSGPFNKDGSNNDVMTGRAVSKVVVHPADANTIFAGTASGVGGIGCDAGTATSSRGLYRSTNAASASPTFQKLTTNTANGGNRSVTDIEFEPGNPNTVLATVIGFSTAGDGGVYRSTNALAPTPTFTQTLPAGTASATSRVELAIN